MRQNKIHECAEQLLRMLPDPKDIDWLADELYKKVYGDKFMEQEIKEKCNGLRAQILEVGTVVNQLHQHAEFKNEQSSPGQHSEMHANITLAYRHLEDARMRLGKVIQAHEGGVSCYDK